jgi:hypothetical protein
MLIALGSLQGQHMCKVYTLLAPAALQANAGDTNHEEEQN